MSTPRVIVIGAGHNGLVAAIRLARAGVEVTVLEWAAAPGGHLRSSHDTLPGFVHDLGAGFFPLTLASPAFREVPLDSLDLKWANPAIAMAHPFLDGGAIALHRDLDATADSLERCSPGAGEAWRGFVARLLPHREALVSAVLGRFPPIGAGLRLLGALRSDAVDLARGMVGSAAGFGLDLLGDRRAAAWLSASALHSDLTPGSAVGAGFAFGLAFLGHVVGWPFPRGGAGRLGDALTTRLTDLGGRVRCDAPVARILVRRGRAAGVALASGEEMAADAVVATVTARPLAAMLPGDALPGRLMRRLRRWRYGLGTFKLDLALSGPVPWRSHEARSAGVVHVADDLDAQFRASYEAGLGRLPREPTVVVGQQSLHDPTRAPAGAHTLYAYTRVPQRPDLDADAMAEAVEARIEAFAPGFRELVIARAARSPQRLERENPSLVGGDLGGGSCEIDQQVIFRPSPALVRYRTPLRGLYVAGASIHPGGGVHGTSGAGAARAILEDRSRLRPHRRL
ncbi:MAG TPA: NAD(P)/FAD-dependent oxidoreductase [Solirubrobacteraceae bacterium]|nr:NAD(P)/FAD-dependent oxidoreductase [Solirubrobacteraceae bacterium]